MKQKRNTKKVTQTICFKPHKKHKTKMIERWRAVINDNVIREDYKNNERNILVLKH